MSASFEPVNPNSNYPKENNQPKVFNLSGIYYNKLIQLLIKVKHKKSLIRFFEDNFAYQEGDLRGKGNSLAKGLLKYKDILDYSKFDPYFKKFYNGNYSRITTKESIQIADWMIEGTKYYLTKSHKNALLEMEPYFRNSGGFYRRG